MPEPGVVTDPDVLELYTGRILRDHSPGRLAEALSIALISLRDEALGWQPLAAWAARELTRLGEAAAPLPDEGVPCG